MHFANSETPTKLKLQLNSDNEIQKNQIYQIQAY